MGGDTSHGVTHEDLEAAWASITETLLTPKENCSDPRERAPRVVFVAGQPASGKTSIEEEAKHGADLRNPVQIDADAMRELHPAYPQWAEEDSLTAAAKTQSVVGGWVDRAIEYVAENRFDAVVSATLKDPAQALAKISPFQDRHYDVFVAFTTMDKTNSSLNIVRRYLDRKRSRWARYVPLDVHDQAYSGVVQTARQIDQAAFGEISVRVYRSRHNLAELAYKNTFDGNAWVEHGGQALAESTIETERRTYWDSNVVDFRTLARSLLIRKPLPDKLREHVARTMHDFLDPAVCLLHLPH